MVLDYCWWGTGSRDVLVGSDCLTMNIDNRFDPEDHIRGDEIDPHGPQRLAVLHELDSQPSILPLACGHNGLVERPALDLGHPVWWDVREVLAKARGASAAAEHTRWTGRRVGRLCRRLGGRCAQCSQNCDCHPDRDQRKPSPNGTHLEATPTDPAARAIRELQKDEAAENDQRNSQDHEDDHSAPPAPLGPLEERWAPTASSPGRYSDALDYKSAGSAWGPCADPARPPLSSSACGGAFLDDQGLRVELGRARAQ